MIKAVNMKNVLAEIQSIANNKEVGTDGIHVEMLKANAINSVMLLTEIWQTVSQTMILSLEFI